MIGPLQRRASDRVIGVPAGPYFDALTSVERVAIQEQLALRYLARVARLEWARDFVRDPVTKAISRRPVRPEITLHVKRPRIGSQRGAPAYGRSLATRSA